MAEVEEMQQEEAKQKRIRRRKKQLYENILKQLEFYFSDACLSKDRFLGNLIKNDPWVPLDIFLKFNKMKALTQCTSDIAKSLKHSTLLECSEDKTKVKRKTPIVPYNMDERTVYVESIPPMATLPWVESIFQQYGNVAYVSLPKFPNSDKIKGFAFIEFSKPEEAQKCIAAFAKMGCKLQTTMPPDELGTVKMVSIAEKNNEKAKKKEKREHKDSKSEMEDSKDVDHEPPKKKHKVKKNKKGDISIGNDKSSSVPGEENQMESKDISECEQNVKPKEMIEKQTENQSGSEINDTQSESEKNETASETEPNENNEPAKRKKPVRKRSKKERKEKQKAKISEESKSAMYGLQVLSKAEWKVLRNKYLNLQRKEMAKLKQAIRSSHTPMYKPPIVQKAEHLNEVQVPNSGIIRKEGVLVKVALPEMCLDVRKLKKEVRSNVHVQHVDVKEGQSQMVIRFDTPETAQQYCSSGIYTSASVLGGTEASECWARAESEWASRRRGRDKLRHRLTAMAAQRQPSTQASTPATSIQASTPATSIPAESTQSNTVAGPTHIRFED